MLWTLYLSFAYLVYAIVLFLVVGFKNLGPIEWTGVAGGPVLIYTIRSAVTAFFNFRIDTLTTRLKDQQTEREKTIQKLKDATKYDTTLELLEKYGGSDNKPRKGKKGSTDEDSPGPQGKKSPGNKVSSGNNMPHRTNIPPPPTANIPRDGLRGPPSGPGTPQAGGPHGPFGPPQQQHQPPAPISGLETSAEFAPNAFGPGGEPPTTHYASSATVVGESHWYDRIMDLLLGEDETAAKNRLVLICQRCRLVNGQAPPGTKTLEEVGRWKCMGCGEMNGTVDEGKRIVDEVLGKQGGHRRAVSTTSDGLSGRSENESLAEGSDLVEIKREDGASESDGAPPPVNGKQKGAKKVGK